MSKAKTFTPSTDNQLFALTVTGQLDQLSTARDKWEKTEYKKANDSLYDLLSQTYAVYEQLFVDAATDADRKTLRMTLEEKLKADGVKVQKTSTTMGLLIRFVFKSDRKRVMRYRYAIEAAKSHGVNATQMAKWLSDNGGIDAVVKLVKQSEEAKAKAEKLTVAKTDVASLIDYRKTHPLANVKIDSVKAKTRTVLIAEPSMDGTFNIVCVVEEISDGIYKGLINTAANQYVADKDESLALQREAKQFSESTNVAEEKELLAA